MATWFEQGEPQPDASITAQPPIRRGKRARAVPVVNVRTEHRRDYYGVDENGKRLKNGTIITNGCKWTDSTRNSCSCPKLLIWSENGKRHKAAAGNDEQDAYRRAREKQANLQAIAEGKPEPEKITRVTIADAVEQFLKTKRDEGYKEKSINRLVLWFEKRLLGFSNAKDLLYINEVTLSHLEQWRSEWKGEAYTKIKAQGRVKGFFKWCYEHDLIGKDPAKGLRKIKNNDRKPTLALTDEQFEQVVNAIPKVNGETTPEQRKKLRALVLLMRWSGLAIKDAVTLERSKLQEDEDGWYRVFLRRAKTGVDVFCTISPEVGWELVALENDSPRYFFVSGVPAKERELDTLIKKWGDLFRKLSKAAALKDENGNAMDFHSHMLRDTFAQWCFLNDLSTEDVAALLGHANIQITQQHYAPFMIARQKRLTNRVKEAHQKSLKAASR